MATGDVKAVYAAKVAITFTAINSLANGSGAESTAVDNTTNKYLDALVHCSLTGTGSTTGLVDFFVYSALGDTTYTDAATGTTAAFTAANRRNSRYLGSIQMNTSGVLSGAFSVAAAFDGYMPSKWGLIAVNNSGAALPASTHAFNYEGVYQNVSP